MEHVERRWMLYGGQVGTKMSLPVSDELVKFIL
jgi:hypothetical protein